MKYKVYNSQYYRYFAYSIQMLYIIHCRQLIIWVLLNVRNSSQDFKKACVFKNLLNAVLNWNFSLLRLVGFINCWIQVVIWTGEGILHKWCGLEAELVLTCSLSFSLPYGVSYYFHIGWFIFSCVEVHQTVNSCQDFDAQERNSSESTGEDWPFMVQILWT